jgi:hypothetical protein
MTHVGDGHQPVRFTSEVTLGSIITSVIVILMAVEVWLFYGLIMDRVDEATSYQRKNRLGLEQLSNDLEAYKTWTYDEAAGLQKQLAVLEGDVGKLKQELADLRRR